MLPRFKQVLITECTRAGRMIRALGLAKSFDAGSYFQAIFRIESACSILLPSFWSIKFIPHRRLLFSRDGILWKQTSRSAKRQRGRSSYMITDSSPRVFCSSRLVHRSCLGLFPLKLHDPNARHDICMSLLCVLPRCKLEELMHSTPLSHSLPLF